MPSTRSSARYTAGANVAARAICQRLHCALVLFKKSRRYLPRSAFGQDIDLPLSTWPLLGVYLEDGRIQIDNLVATQRHPYTIFESCLCRSIDPNAYLRDVLAKPSSMTNYIAPQA